MIEKLKALWNQEVTLGPVLLGFVIGQIAYVFLKWLFS